MKFIKKNRLNEGGYFKNIRQMADQREKRNSLSAEEVVSKIARDAEKNRIRGIIDYIMTLKEEEEKEESNRLTGTHVNWFEYIYGVSFSKLLYMYYLRGETYYECSFVYDISYDVDAVNKTITFNADINKVIKYGMYSSKHGLQLSITDLADSASKILVKFVHGTTALNILKSWIEYPNSWKNEIFGKALKKKIIHYVQSGGGIPEYYNKKLTDEDRNVIRKEIVDLLESYTVIINKITIDPGPTKVLQISACSVGVSGRYSSYNFDRNSIEGLRNFLTSLFSFDNCNEAYLTCFSAEGIKDVKLK